MAYIRFGSASEVYMYGGGGVIVCSGCRLRPPSPEDRLLTDLDRSLNLPQAFAHLIEHICEGQLSLLFSRTPFLRFLEELSENYAEVEGGCGLGIVIDECVRQWGLYEGRWVSINDSKERRLKAIPVWSSFLRRRRVQAFRLKVLAHAFEMQMQNDNRLIGELMHVVDALKDLGLLDRSFGPHPNC